MNSLQTFCGSGLGSWPFHSGEEALPSWGLGTLNVAAAVAQVQRWCHSNTTASAQSRTSGTGAWGTNSCRVPRQLLLGAICQAYLPWLCKHTGVSTKTGQGFPQKQDRASQSCLTCSSPGEIAAEGMWLHPSSLKQGILNVWWASCPAAPLYLEVCSCCRFPVIIFPCHT